MLIRAHLFKIGKPMIGSRDVPEQCRVIFYGGQIFVRGVDFDDCFFMVDHLFFCGIDPDTICVVKYLDHEREAA